MVYYTYKLLVDVSTPLGVQTSFLSYLLRKSMSSNADMICERPNVKSTLLG